MKMLLKNLNFMWTMLVSLMGVIVFSEAGAVVGSNALTLSDWAKRIDPDGKVAKIVEILELTNDIIQDALFIEGNLPTGHKTTIRSGLPSVAWRLLNYGIQPTKSRSVQVTDTVGMLESYSEVDKALADLNGNTAAFRLSEDIAFLEAMSQEFATTLFYGNTSTDPEKFLGLSPRYNDLSAENGENILDAGGSGADNASVWLLVWGSHSIHGIFPKGSQAGIKHEDKGQVTLDDADGGRFEGYRTHYKMDAGLSLRDWRYTVRIANIDVSDLTKDAATGADLVDLMVQAIELVPNINAGKASFYANKTIMSFLRRQVMNKSNVNLTLEDFFGKKILHVDGVPVRKSEALLNSESQVV